MLRLSVFRILFLRDFCTMDAAFERTQRLNLRLKDVFGGGGGHRTDTPKRKSRRDRHPTTGARAVRVHSQ